ncbi:hypothetical protein [Paenibacillus thiaminolyticus]|uniref:Uncharacterized protein n=1 Tax=Paenibacillus thiaminolyticus TaxID=49283 RepID=A0A3A3GUS8_PANTH|nr:hypothetical protein [Paenibacillus thiaminolyticus]RJG21441.1 hypothetical protein DQX05_21450 [Paenibacillus thiaminolyticus]
MNQALEKARFIVKNINWEFEEPNRPSHAVLLYEFLRRGSLFYDYINRDSSRPAVFSAAEMCNIKLPIDIYEICDELNQIKDECLVKSTCKNYLEWAYLVGENIPVALNFQELYIPIIKLFYRGGKNKVSTWRVDLWEYRTLPKYIYGYKQS